MSLRAGLLWTLGLMLALHAVVFSPDVGVQVGAALVAVGCLCMLVRIGFASDDDHAAVEEREDRRSSWTRS